MIRQSVAAGVLAPQGDGGGAEKKTHSSYYIICRGECSPTIYEKLASFDSSLLNAGGVLYKKIAAGITIAGVQIPRFLYIDKSKKRGESL